MEGGRLRRARRHRRRCGCRTASLPAGGVLASRAMAKALEYNATLVERVDVTDALTLFRVKPDQMPAERPWFVPGQYCVLGCNNDDKPELGSVRRSMSIASAPEDDGPIEFYIRFVSQARVREPADPPAVEAQDRRPHVHAPGRRGRVHGQGHGRRRRSAPARDGRGRHRLGAVRQSWCAASCAATRTPISRSACCSTARRIPATSAIATS